MVYLPPQISLTYHCLQVAGGIGLQVKRCPIQTVGLRSRSHGSETQCIQDNVCDSYDLVREKSGEKVHHPF